MFGASQFMFTGGRSRRCFPVHGGRRYVGGVANRVGARHCASDGYSSRGRLTRHGLARVKFLLAHLSDPHVGPLPRPRRRELIGKQVTGYLNWTRSRSRIHDMAVLEQIVTDMRAHHPSHVAMTGDIANIGLPAEFQLARNWLETLGAPEDVSFVPGNHDAYVRGSRCLISPAPSRRGSQGRRATARGSLICGSAARWP